MRRQGQERLNGAAQSSSSADTSVRLFAMSPRAITAKNGRVVNEGDPDFEKVRLDYLESQVRDLHTAIVDIQHRLTRLDGETLQWPGDTYEPAHTEPAN